LFCITCENEKRETGSEFCCSGGDFGQTNGCIINKTLNAAGHELDCLLARVQNGLTLTPFLREVMFEILKQDEINERARNGSAVE